MRLVGRRVDVTFRSELAAPPERVWQWITSVEGISRELRPIMRMTVPKHVRDLRDVPMVSGKALFRSWILLFGVLPIDRSDLTLLTLEEGKGFVEQSPMLSMRLWRHERTLAPSGKGTALTDKLTFEPRLAAPIVEWFIRAVFSHRHRVLRESLG